MTLFYNTEARDGGLILPCHSRASEHFLDESCLVLVTFLPVTELRHTIRCGRGARGSARGRDVDLRKILKHSPAFSVRSKGQNDQPPSLARGTSIY